MENLPSIDEILENQYFQVGMIVWVVFFSGCITRMVPDNLRRLLDHPVVKVGVLALVVYLAEKDFKLAVVVAAGFFLSTAPLNIKEGMTVPDDCKPKINQLGLVNGCENDQCELIPADYLTDILNGGVPAKCEPKCNSAAADEAKCDTIGNNKCALYKTYNSSGELESTSRCNQRCILIKNKDACNVKNHCRWAKDVTNNDGEESCTVRCDQHANADACNTPYNQKFCEYDSSKSKCKARLASNPN